MSERERICTTADQLIDASEDSRIERITVKGELTDLPEIRLLPGVTLSGTEDSSVSFATGGDGIRLSTNNRVHGIGLFASDERCAIHNDLDVTSLGEIEIAQVTTRGRVKILARANVTSGHVKIAGLDIISADARAESDRPNGFGVDVLQGAFTLWNMQPDPAATITADLRSLSVGRDSAPVLGSGIFVSGAGDVGGRMVVRVLETGGVFSTGTIPAGTPDKITGGVFALYGAYVDRVHNRGPVVTFGQNDMALDNWGLVDQWIVDDKVTTFGPSGIGFVNFGTVNELTVNSPIETFGQGARGFNVYAGTVGIADFDRVVTHGDGSVGIQIGQPIGQLMVRRGIETFGGTGDSLVKGVIMTLSAIGLSVKTGGSAREIAINGGIRTHGAGISPLEIQGTVESLHVEGGCVATGGGFD